MAFVSSPVRSSVRCLSTNDGGITRHAIRLVFETDFKRHHPGTPRTTAVAARRNNNYSRSNNSSSKKTQKWQQQEQLRYPNENSRSSKQEQQ